MQTNNEIKSFVKDRIKNSEKQFLWGMSALLFVVPMITIFMPKIYLCLQLVVLIFMYPYLRLIYNNAKGKTLEMEDCLYFKGIGKFLKTTFLVFLNLCSYLFPFILCLGVQLVGMFLEMDIVIMIGEILFGVYSLIFLIKSLRFILYPFYVYHYEEDDLSAHLILEKCKRLMEDEYKDLLFFTFSFIGWFLLDIITFNILSFMVMPLYFSCLAVWFHNHEFGRPMKQYYDVISNDMTKSIDLTQQAMLQQQQQELRDNRQQAIDNYQRQQAQNIPAYRQNNFYNNPPQQPNQQQMPNNYPYPQQGYNNMPMNNGYGGYNQQQMPNNYPYPQQGYNQQNYGQQGYNQQNNQRNPYYNPYNNM